MGGYGIKVEGRNGKRRYHLCFFAGGYDGAIAVAGEGARRDCGSGHGAAHGKALGLQAFADPVEQRLLATEKMGGTGHIQQKAARAIERHIGREAVAPVGDAGEQFQIIGFVCRHDLERRQHGARIGQRLANGKAQRGGLAVHGGEAQRIVHLCHNHQRRRFRRLAACRAVAAGRSEGAETTAPRSASLKRPSSQLHSMTHSPVRPCRLRTRPASKTGWPQFSSCGGEAAARTSQRVSAVLASGSRIEAQEKSGDGFLRTGERQPPACHQIENFRLARNLDDDGAQGRTGERIICGAKCIRCIGHTEQQQACRINSKFKKPGRRKFAEFEGGKILADPEQAFAQGHAGGEAGCETRCRRFMANCRENLMQHAALKPALQAEIGGGVAERNADGCFLQSRLGEGSPKGRYLFRAHGLATSCGPGRSPQVCCLLEIKGCLHKSMKERNRNIVKRICVPRV